MPGRVQFTFDENSLEPLERLEAQRGRTECFYCDEKWPTSRDRPGEHDIEADGVYGTAPCRKPEEYAKYQARKEKDEAITLCWVKASERWPNYPMMRDSYFRDLLKERGLTD